MKFYSRPNSNVSRGYAGYFGTWYLRSLLEFKVAHYVLDLAKRFNLKAQYEPNYLTFNIGNHNYKPDFFLKRDDKIVMIFEVKSNEIDAKKCLDDFYSFFKNKGIKYRVIYSAKHFEKIVQKYNISQDRIKEWKNNSTYDYSGENNPTFGLKWSEETKKKIGQRTKERCKNKEYLENLKKSISNGMTLEVRKRISESRINFGKKNKIEFEKNNPILEFKCDNCGKIYKKRECDDGNFKNFNFRSCSKGCTQKLKLSHGILTKLNKKWQEDDIIKRFRRTLILQGLKVFNEFGEFDKDKIQRAKELNVLKTNSQLSEKSIIKYFGNFESFIKEIISGNNCSQETKD